MGERVREWERGSDFRKMLMITLYAEQEKKKRTQIYNSLLDSVGEGEGGMFQENSIETCILSRVNRSPAQVGCMRQGLRPGALGKPRGIG